MKRVLSGIQSSGSLHLGNYFGMMERMIKYQDSNDLYCFIANYHALTVLPNAGDLNKNTYNAVCDFLALGLDPNKCTFWVQSDVPQVTELTWILTSLVNRGLLDRATSFKDKVAKGLSPNMGLYSYPILMAADILLFNSELVPVGNDQKQHLEMTREIANRFNHQFEEVFIIPKEDIDEKTKLVPGIDGQKMSKSYNNIIPIFDDSKIIKKKVMRIKTDTTEINKPKSINTPLFQIYSLFLDSTEKKDLKLRFETPGMRYGDVKLELFNRIMDYFGPYRIKREHFFNNPAHVKDIMYMGAKKAQNSANEVLEKVRTATGISF
jgi:tryptophanyl-tRNA synthetase